jgi:hypothetical protein
LQRAAVGKADPRSEKRIPSGDGGGPGAALTPTVRRGQTSLPPALAALGSPAFPWEGLERVTEFPQPSVPRLGRNLVRASGTFRQFVRLELLQVPRHFAVCCALPRCESRVVHRIRQISSLGVRPASEDRRGDLGGGCFPCCQGSKPRDDPSAGSPTDTLLRLLLPLSAKVCPASPSAGPEGRTPGARLPAAGRIQRSHRSARSVGATGGVYKGQGRIQRALLTRAYKAFLVQDE